jgi:L-threonylcarbamoyladenylate synthase
VPFSSRAVKLPRRPLTMRMRAVVVFGLVSTVYDCAVAERRVAGLVAAAGAVRAGQLVVLPTDTVYGLGCDAFSSTAVQALLSAKGRGRDMPVPVLVGSWSTVDGLVLGVPSRARALIEAFWPGGLSLVLPHAPSLSWDLGDTRGTVMLRMPLHPVALELLREVGPMAVSSANRSGQPPATTIEQAREQLADRVGVFLDGGPAGQMASTIVDLTGDEPVVLREGAVSAAEIGEVLGVTINPAL